jgi:ATP-binding cassette subfamily B (MDR/TAP) protein 1
VYYSWRLTLVILASIPVLVLLTSLATRKLEVAVEKQKYELNRASKYAITAIAHADTIKAYNAQDEEVWQFQGVIKKAACWYLAQANAMAVQWGITRFFMIAIFIQGFWFGLTLVNQEVNAGTILTTFYSVLMAVQAIEALIPQWIIQMEVKNGRKVTKMIGALTPTTCYGDIKFQDVSKLAFENLSPLTNSGHIRIPVKPKSSGS